MKLGDKVTLLGFIDGCSYETTGQTNFIISLETGERVEVPIECVIKKDQVVKKDEIKLKDIIRRINRLDENSKTYWLDTILNWFRLDFGLTKYRQGYEQGKFEGMLELDRVTIPQYIADKIEYARKYDYTIFDAMMMTERDDDFYDWLHTDDNIEVFARAWLDGYEVEKEPKYTVKIKATKHYFAKDGNGRIYFSLKYESAFTKIELEKANLGWVFDCLGIEVREVEE